MRGPCWYYSSGYSLRAAWRTIKALGRDDPTQRPASVTIDLVHSCSGHLIERLLELRSKIGVWRICYCISRFGADCGVCWGSSGSLGAHSSCALFLGSPSPYMSFLQMFLSPLPCRLFADLQTSSSIRPFLELLPCTPASWHTARSNLFLSSPTSRSSPRSVSLSRSLSFSLDEEQLLESLLNVTGPAHHVVFLLRWAAVQAEQVGASHLAGDPSAC